MQTHTSVPQTKKTIEALWRLEKIILDTLDFSQVTQKICDGLLNELGYLDLGYRIIVLTLVDKEKKALRRIALSQTQEARRAQEVSAVPFHQIDIPLSATDNILVKTAKTGLIHITKDWKNLFCPILSPEQARLNQKASGISTSMVYPIKVREQPIGAVIFSMVKSDKDVGEEERDLLRGFCDVIGLAVQNAKLFSELEKKTVQLKNANRKLKELDQLKDEFVSVASHELRTPLTSIKSYLWMALAGKGGPVSAKQAYYLERSASSAERLIKLVNDMLNVSRIESGRMSMEPAQVSMKGLCLETLYEVKARAEELGIQLKLVTSPKTSKESDFQVVADADKLKEVLINFIGNSLKFTAKGGQITIIVIQEKDQVVTQISDTGIGLDPLDIPNLFQKFGFQKGSYRTNREASQGTGLGLYICKSIIDLHKGRIWAKSEGRGKGACFAFALPTFSAEFLRRLKKLHGQNSSKIGIIHSTV